MNFKKKSDVNKQEKKRNQYQFGLTFHTHYYSGHETRITTLKKNYEAQISTNLMLRNEIKKKNNFKKGSKAKRKK